MRKYSEYNVQNQGGYCLEIQTAFLLHGTRRNGTYIMTRHTDPDEPEKYRRKLIELLDNFEEHLKNSELRTQVLELIPASHLLQSLGAALIREPDAGSARSRILAYMKKYVGVILSGEELSVVAGISEYARRVRELRVEHGWNICTGVTLDNMEPDDLATVPGVAGIHLRPDQYILLSDKQDTEAAYRWHVANDIRKEKTGAREKILKYFRAFVGKEISGEELVYVAGNKTEWARRTRELRTEYGWPVVTKFTGRPDLPIGVYVLESDRQSPAHDRKIQEADYRAVLVRDHYTCRDCGWTHEQWNKSDPRHLEVHHILAHVDKGSNAVDNLMTLCTVCHDTRHRRRTS